MHSKVISNSNCEPKADGLFWTSTLLTCTLAIVAGKVTRPKYVFWESF